MKRNSKQFLALFMAVAMSVTPVSYAYAEDSAVAGVENTESGQQTVEVTDGKIGAANACKMDVDVLKTPDHPECIRCGACIKACPKDAIHYQFMGMPFEKKASAAHNIQKK